MNHHHHSLFNIPHDDNYEDDGGSGSAGSSSFTIPNSHSMSGGFGNDAIETEINVKIKKKFEAAIQYFIKMVEIILMSNDFSSQEKDVRSFHINNGNRHHHHFMMMDDSSNHNNNHNIFVGGISPSETTTSVKSGADDREKLLYSSHGSSSSSNDDGDNDFSPGYISHRDIFLARPENQKIIMDLSKTFWKRNYKYRENLYFSLQSVQDSLLVEQIISQSFNNFVEDCHLEIINKFEDSHTSLIDLLKLSRGSPEKIFDTPNLEKYSPTIKTPKPTYSDGMSTTSQITTIINNIWIKYFQFYMIRDFIVSLFPIFIWIKKYKLNYLKDDVLTSLTIGFMLIPQAMAYAILAGLPPIYGLYSAFISPIVYGIFGTSNEIAVGPVAMVSLLIPSIIDHPPGSDIYIIYATCLSLLSGLILFTFGLLRVGFIIETLLSNPILLGFIQAGSILIMFSQIKNLTSIPISSKASNVIDFMKDIKEHIQSIHWATVIVAIMTLTLLLVAKYVNKKIKYKIPMPILILIFGTLISYLVDAKQKFGIKIIDEIPSGIPSPQTVPLDIFKISKMFVGAIILSILGFVESISIGKKFASLKKYNINVSQELIALGMCNMVQSVFHGYPTTGSFSRTAVAYQSGSQSRLTSILTGIIVMIVLLLLTSAFKYTPLCLLACIVMVAAIGLFEPMETFELYKKGELLGFIQLIFVFFCTLLLGSETGIIIAFCVSILQIIFFSSRPNLVTLGRLPGTLVFRNIKHYPNAITHGGIMVVRYDSRMTYYTINHFRDSMARLINDSNPLDDIKVIIIDAVNVSSVDSTALDVLNEMLDFYENNGIMVLWSDIRHSVRSVMVKSKFTSRITPDHIFASTSSAVEYALANLNRSSFEITAV